MCPLENPQPLCESPSPPNTGRGQRASPGSLEEALSTALTHGDSGLRPVTSLPAKRCLQGPSSRRTGGCPVDSPVVLPWVRPACAPFRISSLISGLFSNRKRGRRHGGDFNLQEWPVTAETAGVLPFPTFPGPEAADNERGVFLSPRPCPSRAAHHPSCPVASASPTTRSSVQGRQAHNRKLSIVPHGAKEEKPSSADSSYLTNESSLRFLELPKAQLCQSYHEHVIRMQNILPSAFFAFPVNLWFISFSQVLPFR